MASKEIALKTKRFYKVKNPAKSFLCALCRAPRSMKYKKNLSLKRYFQILIISAFITWALLPVIGPESFFAIFLVWPVMEVGNKLLYRREIPCPYCGFDATWYRRDVKKANQLVKEFWSKNYPELVSPKVSEDVLATQSKSGENPSEAEEAPSQQSVN